MIHHWKKRPASSAALCTLKLSTNREQQHCSYREDVCPYLCPHLDPPAVRSLCPQRRPDSSSLYCPSKNPHSCSSGTNTDVYAASSFKILITCRSDQHFHSWNSVALLSVSHRLTGLAWSLYLESATRRKDPQIALRKGERNWKVMSFCRVHCFNSVKIATIA